MLKTEKVSSKKFFNSLVQSGARAIASLEMKATEEGLPKPVKKAYIKESKACQRVLTSLFSQVSGFDPAAFEDAIQAHFHHLIGDDEVYYDT